MEHEAFCLFLVGRDPQNAVFLGSKKSCVEKCGFGARPAHLYCSSPFAGRDMLSQGPLNPCI